MRTAYLCRLVRLLGRALGLAGRVAQREDDGLLVDLAHLAQNLRSEGAGLGGRACNKQHTVVNRGS